MLIRSQNKKELLNLDNAVSISVDDDNEIIIAYGFDHTWDRMGNYSTEEKAIKVLDEIQRQYARFSCRYGSDCSYDAVYNMPQDSEV